MGIDKTLYVGAYLEVTPKLVKTTKRVLVDVEGKKTGNLYDPLTGKKNKSVDEEVSYYLYPDEYLEERLGTDTLRVVSSDIFEDPLSSYKYLVDNYYEGITGKYFEIYQPFSLTSEETIRLMVESIPTFKENFKKEIKVLEEKFGPVQVKSGIFLLVW